MSRARCLRRSPWLRRSCNVFVAALVAALPLLASADEPTKEKPQPEATSKSESKSESPEKPAAVKPAEPKATEPAPQLPAIELPPGRTIFGSSDLERKIRASLDEPAELQYLDTKLSDACLDMELRYKIPLALDKAALTADGKDGDLEISFRVRQGSLRNALKLMLGQHDLAYAVHNDVLLITTKTQAETLISTRVYQVHDLVVMPNDPAAVKPNFDALLEIITTSVQPESWRANGGISGEFKEFRGPGVLALVITHTEEGHDQISALLSMLREAHEPKVLEVQKRAKPVKESESPPSAVGSGPAGTGFY